MLPPAFGGGFDGLLQSRAGVLCGVVAGIDTTGWNPEIAPHIAPHNYSSRDVDDAISEKRQIKKVLRDWRSKDGRQPFANLRMDTVLVALVGRIADQKFPILLPNHHWV